MSLVVLLSTVPLVSAAQTAGSLPTIRPSDVFSTEGDVLIGAVTPMHAVMHQTHVSFQQPPEQPLCTQFKSHFFLNALGLLFAVAESREDPSFLPNITVGLQIHDSCISGTQALHSTLALLSNQLRPTPNFSCGPQRLLLGVIGGMTSPESQPMAELLSVYRVPQISHGSQHPQFSNHHRFPSFLRTVPSSAHQPWLLARLLDHFKWTWVGLVGSDNGNFEQLDQQLRALVSIQRAATHITSTPTARVIICDCYHFHFQLLAEALEDWVVGRTWVFSTSFLYSPSVLDPRAQRLLDGSLNLAISAGTMPGLQGFLLALRPAAHPDSSLLRKLWEQLHQCKWPGLVAFPQSYREGAPMCTGLENMTVAHLAPFRLSDLSATYQAYLAARALLVAYQTLTSCSAGEGPFLLYYTQNVRFTTSAQEEIFFTREREMLTTFDIQNIKVLEAQRGQKGTVGHFNFRAPAGKELEIQEAAVTWAGGGSQVPSSVCNEKCPVGTRKSALHEKSKCCYECLPCPRGEIAPAPDSAVCKKCPGDQWPGVGKSQCIPRTLDFLSYHEPLGMVLATCAALLFLLTLAVLGIFIRHHHSPIVRANNRRLSYLLLAALALCFLCPFLFLGHPGIITCAMRQAAFGVTFTVCVSTVLAKTVVVVAAFHTTQPGIHISKWVGSRLPSTIPSVCSLIQAALCTLWVAQWPPRPMNSTEPGASITVKCDGGSVALFYTMLGYLALLALVSLLVAFPARRLPDTFNEAKHITISMLVCSCVWVSFIPAHVSTQGKDTVAVEVFAILASAAGLMCCLFFPKCYIILLHPERNTRGQVLGRQDPK
nr:extracellular calcium-sensing receptor-like [Cavia porcellus]